MIILPSPNKKKYFLIFLLIFLTIIAYIPSFEGVWQYDDNIVLLKNESIKNGIFNLDTLSKSDKFRIIPMITFAINYSLGEFNLFGYHLFNLIIHIFSGIMIYFFIVELFSTLKLKKKIDYPYKRFQQIAFITALLWLVAPINTQAVTYIVQRMTSLGGLFYFSSLFLFLRFKNYKLLNNRNCYKLIVSFILTTLCSLLSKQNSFLLFPTIFYIEWSFYRDAKFKENKKYFIYFGILLILLGVFVLSFFDIVNNGNIASIFKNYYHHREFTPLQRLFIEPKILIHYISLMFFPFVGRFHLLYSFDWQNAAYQVFPYVSFCFIFGAFYNSFKYASKYKILSFSVFFFIINHVIESSVIGIQLVAEHRNYIPSLGIFLIIAVLFDKLQNSLKRDNILKALFVIFIIFSIFNTFILNLKYKENHCNAIYDYTEEYNALNYDIVDKAMDKLMYNKQYKNSYKILDLEYKMLTLNPSRQNFYSSYFHFSTIALMYYVHQYYFSSGLDIDKTLSFIEKKFIYDKDFFWVKLKKKKYYDNIFYYFYVKSLFLKYKFIDNINYQKFILCDSNVFNYMYYFKRSNYNEFRKYILNDIEKLNHIELTKKEKKVLIKFHENTNNNSGI